MASPGAFLRFAHDRPMLRTGLEMRFNGGEVVVRERGFLFWRFDGVDLGMQVIGLVDFDKSPRRCVLVWITCPMCQIAPEMRRDGLP